MRSGGHSIGEWRFVGQSLSDRAIHCEVNAIVSRGVERHLLYRSETCSSCNNLAFVTREFYVKILLAGNKF